MRARGSGFSLLEVVIAVGVLAIALLGLFAVLAGSNRVNSLSSERTQVVNTAMSEIDKALLEDWTTLVNGTTVNGRTFPVRVEMAGGKTLFLKPGAGRSAVGLVNVTSGGTTDMVLVEVSARWQSTVGKDLEVVLRCMVARH